MLKKTNKKKEGKVSVSVFFHCIKNHLRTGETAQSGGTCHQIRAQFLSLFNQGHAWQSARQSYLQDKGQQ